jgi:hypothetical protein
MRSYKLSAHTHVCVTTKGAVFLDLKQSTYIGLDPVQSRALSAMVEGWPLFNDGDPVGAVGYRFAESLVSRGLLVHAREQGRTASPPLVPQPDAELIAWDEMPSRLVRPHHVLSFLRASLAALFLTRCRSFDAIAARIRHRRRRRGQVFTTAQARELVSAYHYVRTWAFARAGRCLLDSLALMEFLSLYGVHPFWVVGVQVRPFSAHSWVQYDRWVLNGSPAFVRDYTPILVA